MYLSRYFLHSLRKLRRSNKGQPQTKPFNKITITHFHNLVFVARCNVIKPQANTDCAKVKDSVQTTIGSYNKP